MSPAATSRSAPWPAVSLALAHALLTAPDSRFEIGEAVVRGRPTCVWKHAPPTRRELFLFTGQFGAHDFLVHEEDRASYEGFARAALAIAAELQNRGMQKGDRIAIAMRNLPECPTIFFGAVLAGAIVAPLNAWLTADELLFGLKDCVARFAFFDAGRLVHLGPRLAECPVEHVYVGRHSGALPQNIRRLEDLTGKILKTELRALFSA